MTKTEAITKFNTMITKFYRDLNYVAPEVQQLHWERFRIDAIQLISEVDDVSTNIERGCSTLD